jgi:hypothetical protein
VIGATLVPLVGGIGTQRAPPCQRILPHPTFCEPETFEEQGGTFSQQG